MRLPRRTISRSSRSPLITAQGRNLHDPDFKLDPTLAPLIKPGFAMAAGDDAQIVPVKPDEQVGDHGARRCRCGRSAPFAEVRAAVESNWKPAQGATKAREAASKPTALLNRGVAVEEALKQAGIVGQPRQPLAVRRAELGQYQGKIPPPIIAALAMRAGSARLVQMERNFGFAGCLDREDHRGGSARQCPADAVHPRRPRQRAGQ